MSITSRSRLGTTALSVVLLAGGTLLSACGVSDERPRPGVAAQVGDEKITTDTVDDTTDDVCAYSKDQGYDPVPRSFEQQQLVNALITRSAVQQVMEERDLTFDDNEDYAAAVKGLQAQVDEQLPDEFQDVIGALSLDALETDYGYTVIGASRLDEDGVDKSLDSKELGQATVAEWLADHDVTINPIYELTVDDGVVQVDGGKDQLDVLDPNADLAELNRQAALIAADLPADQTCGG